MTKSKLDLIHDWLVPMNQNQNRQELYEIKYSYLFKFKNYEIII